MICQTLLSLGKKILLMGATYRQDIADTRFSASETFFKKVLAIIVDIDIIFLS